MRLMTTNNTDLLDDCTVRTKEGRVIVNGTNMGYMSVQAVLLGTEWRRGYDLVSFGTLLQTFKTFLAGKGA